MPLHLSLYAILNALATSLIVAFSGKFIVFDTALSVCFWKAAWSFMCHSGFMSDAVRNTSLTFFGTLRMCWTEPFFAISLISSFEWKPFSLAVFSKSSLVSRRCVPPITFLTKLMPNRGSMPLEHPAIMLMVPVGATVVTDAFLILLYLPLSVLLLKLGKLPLSPASFSLSLRALWCMAFISFSAVFAALSESYGILSLTSMSAKPITPRPIFLFAFVTSSISSSGNLLASSTLSRNLVASFAVLSSFLQSIFPSFTCFARLMLPRLHDS